MAKGLKHLSRRLIPFFIAGLTVLVTVTASNFSLLHPQAVNAQQVSRGNGKVEIQLPSTGLQDDDWSCGPNSAARVLRFYGFNSTYDDLRRTVKRLGKFPGSNRLGTAPHELRNAMSRWAGGEVKLEREARFERLLSLVSQGKPVITLVRVGTIEDNRIGGIGIGGTWPAMHWFVVNGFDQNTRRIYITDTTIDQRVGSNRYTLTYDDFMSQWSWGIGRGAASSTLDANGVKTRTMVWVDRTPDSLASSPAQPRVGYFDNKATVFFSNGSSYCGFASPNHLQFFRSVNSAPSLGRQDPSNFGTYTGACSLPSGYFDNGSAVFFSQGNGTFCGFPNPQSYASHGGSRPQLPRFGRIDVDPNSFMSYAGACQ